MEEKELREAGTSSSKERALPPPAPATGDHGGDVQSDTAATELGSKATADVTVIGIAVEGLPATPEAARRVDGGSGQDAASAQEPQLTSSKTAVDPGIPEPFLALRNHCDSIGVKCSIDAEIPAAGIELKSGRETRSVFIISEESAQSLTEIQLQDLVLLGDLAAVCCYRERWIEAAIRIHGTIGRNLVRRRLFGSPDSEPAEIAIDGGPPVLKLTDHGRVLPKLDYSSAIYLRIEEIGITQHDQALTLLEDLSNSLFMQIDFRFDTALGLVRDRFLARRAPLAGADSIRITSWFIPSIRTIETHPPFTGTPGAQRRCHCCSIWRSTSASSSSSHSLPAKKRLRR
jgi:hypothetical protein